MFFIDDLKSSILFSESCTCILRSITNNNNNYNAGTSTQKHSNLLPQNLMVLLKNGNAQALKLTDFTIIFHYRNTLFLIEQVCPLLTHCLNQESGLENWYKFRYQISLYHLSVIFLTLTAHNTVMLLENDHSLFRQHFIL